jgi:hypothetical protein
MPGISFDYIRFSHNNPTQKIIENYWKILHGICSEYVLYFVRYSSKFSSWENFGKILGKLKIFLRNIPSIFPAGKSAGIL